LTRATFTPAEEVYVSWTPDGERLVFDSAGPDGRPNVFLQAADGTGTPEQLTDNPDRPRPLSVSPDGRQVVVRVGTTPPYDLGLLRVTSPPRIEPLLTTPFNESNAEVSPNGRWLVYESDESGRSDIYVRPFPDVDRGKWRVSRDGGTRPAWSRDGKELFYIVKDKADTVVMSVKVESDSSWAAGTPTRRFAGRYFADDTAGTSGQGRTYDVAADGRFLMLKEAPSSDGGGPVARLVVVQHWDDELKRLVPTN
jgi:serine/threonine-protein kinase